MSIDVDIFKKVLEAIINNALPILAIFWIFERPAVTKFLKSLEPWLKANLNITVRWIKRYGAIVLSIVISTVIYYLYCVIGFDPLPASFVEWMDIILTLGAINFAGTQVLHGTRYTAKRQSN